MKCLTIVDDETREAVTVEVQAHLCVARVLGRLALSRGLASILRSGSGREFRGKMMVKWAHERGMTLCLIKTGFVESERLHREH